MSSHHCAIDGYLLEVFTDGKGNLVVKCEACWRRRARRCIDCGQPVVGRSWRCETHKRLAKREARQRSESRNRDERRAVERKRYWANKERRKERCRQWAKDNQSVYWKDGKPIFPRCAKCGSTIAWDRRGRPKKYHPQCNPWTASKSA